MGKMQKKMETSTDERLRFRVLEYTALRRGWADGAAAEGFMGGVCRNSDFAEFLESYVLVNQPNTD